MADKSAPAGDFELRVARVLAAYVKAQGLTVSEVARRAGLSQPFVSQVLSGQRGFKIDTLHALCDALEVPISSVMLDVEANPPKPRVVDGTGRRTG